MNTDTGKIYYTKEEIEAARKRGEPIVPVSDEVAMAQMVGQAALSGMNRHERRKAAADARKAAR